MHTFNQVKLIVTDMDGTLLNSQRELPADFFDTLDRLHEKGILFAIASGRSYPTLSAQFHDYKNKLIFMAENGGCIVKDDRLIHMDILPVSELERFDILCRQLDHAYPVFSGYHTAYIRRSIPDSAKKIIHMYYQGIQYIDQLSDIAEPICKVTVCDPEGAEANAFPHLRQSAPPCRATLAGYIWIDLGFPHVNKGTGLDALQRQYHISPDETMVFGDYLNDCEMMQKGYFSYAMSNAHPQLKAISRFETLSNDEDGVMHIIRQLI